jgi:hypothetical protein
MTMSLLIRVVRDIPVYFFPDFLFVASPSRVYFEMTDTFTLQFYASSLLILAFMSIQGLVLQPTVYESSNRGCRQ